MATGKKKSGAPKQDSQKKLQALEECKETGDGEFLTTNQGVRINDNQNSLKAGVRGPSLLEDFILREKITHFDHERIPERIVHARGAAAHGVFQVYKPLSDVTRAHFLNNPALETPVFVRFSTVAGSRGSSDLARDARGFAVKFYTEEGNFDLVGNNIPVFFIQDAVKFPDLVHAVKPEPHNEIPQAASAHDTFWDFISIMPESMHMIMWVMSDRAIPRSFRMMEGFGIHTFRLINGKGEGVFVKFHWKPLLGAHSVCWDEAQQISGRDGDFHRRDLWTAIENGNFPEWEFGLQIVPEKDEHKFPFDLLDPTKIIPEELVPVLRVGKMTLNRNPDNFFAETEQVAFHPGHLVPGIDFSNDPLLQGRLFSYTDTQLLRLGGPNFHEIPINRPVSPVHNNQRDGHMRQTINKGKTNYEPNTLANGCPFQAGFAKGGFTSYSERVDGHKIRERSPSFMDHFSQATLFFNSLAEHEQAHLIDALRFELGKLESDAIRLRVLGLLGQVDANLAAQVAQDLSLAVPEPELPMNRSYPADADPAAYQPKSVPQGLKKSAALSMVNQPFSAATRQVAILVADGFDATAVASVKKALTAAGAQGKLVGTRVGKIKAGDGSEAAADFSIYTSDSVLFDAVFVPGGEKSVQTLLGHANSVRFVNGAYRHCKALAASGEGQQLLVAGCPGLKPKDNGIVQADSGSGLAAAFVEAIAAHRAWDREKRFKPPAK